MKKGKKIVEILKKPNGWLIAAVFILTLIFAAGSIVLSVIGNDDPFLQIISYVVYALAAIFLGYSVYIVVVYYSKIKNGILNLIKKSSIGRRMLSQYSFRTVVFAAFSMIINVLFIAFNVVLAVIEKSFWFACLALYYAMLVAMRGGIVLYQRKKIKNGVEIIESDKQAELKKYGNCGIMLSIVPLCLVVPLLQIIFLNKAFVHQGLTIYAFAAYAFYKIVMAIINVFKTNKYNDYTLKAIRNVSLADAFVSIFQLQTALLFAFSDGQKYSYANLATGSVVFVLTVALGIYMIIKSRGEIKKLEEEENEK